MNFKSFEITDISTVISTVPKNIWKPSLEQADILVFGGGDASYLIDSLQSSGVSKLLPGLLKNKIYVGISAGSMIATPNLLGNINDLIYFEDGQSTHDTECLGFVDFYFLPHLNSDYFQVRNDTKIRELTRDIKKKIYILDDNSAIEIDGEKMKVISEGEWFSIN